MDIISLTYPFSGTLQSPADKQIIAIGDFDGVHCGHQEVLARAGKSAASEQIPLAIMTFDPHPRKVLGMDKYDQLLTPTSQKLEIFEKLGVKRTYLVTFNEHFMRLSPSQFVEEALIPLCPETVVVGFDFHFGFRAEGNPDRLCELSRGRFAVEVVRPYQLEGRSSKVSSTSIREALSHGQVKEANLLLGRKYGLRGEVIHGDARGRTIGFPTANLRLTDAYLVPGNGVYAVYVLVEGETYRGVMNIGFRPTFDTGELRPSVEVHILDFSRDIYGQVIEVELVDFIRDERKFPGIDELIKQIQADVLTARDMLQS